MSFILMIFYWVVVPPLLLSATWWLLRQAKTLPLKIGVIVLSAGILSWMLWVAVGETYMLDKQVRELCAKDGGIKVYETVPLPPELVDEYGVIRIPTKEKAEVSDQYYYTRLREYIRKGNPEVWKRIYSIYRRVDNKLLGESTRYVRRGGDLPGPWHESAFGCPRIGPNQPQLVTSVFIKEKIK